jgi:hypothetical protein
MMPDVQKYIMDINGDYLSLFSKNEKFQAEIQRMSIVLKIREEQIALFNLWRWGPKADKLSQDQLQLLPDEIVVSSPEVDTEASLPPESCMAHIRWKFVEAGKLATLDPLEKETGQPEEKKPICASTSSRGIKHPSR